jgi:hypothetical protein
MVAGNKPAQEAIEPKARIFISYSRKDMAFADRLEAALKARGFEPLIDRTEIYAFEDWWKRIETLIGGADTVVFVLSPDAVTSDVALKEIACAASLNKRFAPIVCRRTDDSAVPEPLRRLNFIFFDDPARFEARADQLADSLGTGLGGCLSYAGKSCQFTRISLSETLAEYVSVCDLFLGRSAANSNKLRGEPESRDSKGC